MSNTHSEKQPESKAKAAAEPASEDMQAEKTVSADPGDGDQRPQTIVQRRLQEIAANSPLTAQQAPVQRMISRSLRREDEPGSEGKTQLPAGAEPAKPFQLKASPTAAGQVSPEQQQPPFLFPKAFPPPADPGQPTQLMGDPGGAAAGTPTPNTPPVNQTGLPDTLKSGIEHLSGLSLDDVKVHYNSDQPAQLQAHAFAQGTNIHMGPGQETHLAHEAWHVVQQKQGRVRPTMQLKGTVPVNDDAGLEKEADLMGAKAWQLGASTPLPPPDITPFSLQAPTTGIVQGEFKHGRNIKPEWQAHPNYEDAREILDRWAQDEEVHPDVEVQALLENPMAYWNSMEEDFEVDWDNEAFSEGSEEDDDLFGGEAYEDESTPLIQVNPDIKKRFKRLRAIGRKAEHLKGKLKARRRDEIISAGKGLAVVWAKAGVFAALDVALPGAGTAAGVADATYGAGKNVRDKAKVGGGKKEVGRSGAEYAAGGGLTAAGVAGESIHWTAGAAVGTVRNAKKIGKAALQSDASRKADKMGYAQNFLSEIGNNRQEILAECDALITDLQISGPSEGPGKRELEMIRRVEKAKQRISDMFDAIQEYFQKHTAQAPLLGGGDMDSNDEDDI